VRRINDMADFADVLAEAGERTVTLREWQAAHE
jgi:hypothetical protein